MDRKWADRFALAAFAGLMVYGLACVYRVAWSPDSRNLVFTLLKEDEVQGQRVQRLLMTDLEGRSSVELDRAAADGEHMPMSAAAWSPDGATVAWLKLEAPPADEQAAEPQAVLSVY